ncbi:MAG: BrnT family toxin [Terriglobales bacterium]
MFSDPVSGRLKFEWDASKNRSNIRKHGFDFAAAEELFRGPLLIRPDAENDFDEERWLGIGMIQGRVVFVAFVERPQNIIRIISLRKADHEERQQYEEAIRDGLEAD